MKKINQDERDKLSIEVYDRKIKIYHEIKEFLLYLMSIDIPERKKLSEFSIKTDEALFLFNTKVQKYISEIYSKAVRQRLVNKRLSDRKLPVGDKRSELAEEDYNIGTFYSEQFDRLKSLFAKYIYLE